MLDETFAESIVHDRAGHRVLGLRLRPYSFWHAGQLELRESPFAGADRSFDFAQLLLAALVCRTRYPQRIALRGPAFRLRSKFVAFAFVKHFLRELNAFFAYLADYNSHPIYAQGDNSSAVKTPWYLVAVSKLRMNAAQMGRPISEAAAWDTPVGYGLWLNASCAQARGERVDIMTNEDREAFREAGVPGF